MSRGFIPKKKNKKKQGNSSFNFSGTHNLNWQQTNKQTTIEAKNIDEWLMTINNDGVHQ